MQHVVVDIETNGAYPPKYSMVSIGAVHNENPSNTFYAELKPIGDAYQDEAYAVNGFTHEQVQRFENPAAVMFRFRKWVEDIRGAHERILFVSDTTSFDFSFVNYYLWEFTGANPFGHAPLSIHNVYKGLTGNFKQNIYALRDTRHTHNALDDAKGNQEAFAKVEKMMEERMASLKG